MDSQHDSALPWYDDRVKTVSGWTRGARHNNAGKSAATCRKVLQASGIEAASRQQAIISRQEFIPTPSDF